MAKLLHQYKMYIFILMDSWVTIQIFTLPTDAQMAQLRLESEGITCFLKDEETIGVMNLYSNALGGIKLQVLNEDVEQAREILINGGFINTEKSTQKKNIEVIDDSTISDKNKCPYCGSDNIDTVVHPSFWVIFFYFVLSVIFPIFKSWEKCYDCSKEWKYKKI